MLTRCCVAAPNDIVYKCNSLGEYWRCTERTGQWSLQRTESCARLQNFTMDARCGDCRGCGLIGGSTYLLGPLSDHLGSKFHELGLGTPKMGCSRNWRLHGWSPRRRHWDQLLSTRPQVFKGPIASEHQTLWWLAVRCLQYHHVSSTWGVIFSPKWRAPTLKQQEESLPDCKHQPIKLSWSVFLDFFSIHWAIAIKDDQSYLSTLCVSLVAPYSLDCIEPIIEPPPLLPPKRTKGMAKLGIDLI